MNYVIRKIIKNKVSQTHAIKIYDIRIKKRKSSSLRTKCEDVSKEMAKANITFL
jgi:hypothetical protein